MCKFGIFTPKDTNYFVVPFNDVVNKFQSSFNQTISIRDSHYWFTDYDGWVKIILEAFGSAPAYQTIDGNQRGFDCDKFARHLCDYAAVNYLLNGVWEVWGNGGSHAWNIIWTQNEIFELEPNGGEIWILGSNPSYKIDKIIT